MHRTLRIAIAPLSIVTALITGLALADIKGSKHDFSVGDWAKAGVEACGVCHIPANETPPAKPPLWDSRADLTARFGKSAVRDSDPGMGSLSCLRCHDGTIAKDATGAVIPRERFVSRLHPGFLSGGHGGSDHPVGVEFPRHDRWYHPISAVESGWKVRLPGGRVECSSCHDPHNDSGFNDMLVMSNAGSALCLKCHRK